MTARSTLTRASRVRWCELSAAERQVLLGRPAGATGPELVETTRKIVESVRAEGDAAVLRFTQELDHVKLERTEIDGEVWSRARREISADALAAIERAARQIEIFHRQALGDAIEWDVSPGVRCTRRALPIERVGLYVPGGTAPLISTVLMLGVPARLAGCPVRILCTPPRPQHQHGRAYPVDPHILAAAELAGVQRVFAVGGAQAIAAMAYGTESIPKVDKIFGPGNPWVTRAKLLCQEDPDGAVSDLPAGPSEVLVIADAGADAVFVASDLLSQAEHGVDSQVLCLSPSRELLDKIAAALEIELHTLPRADIARAALAHSALVETRDLVEAMAISNQYAPEHLILHVDDARAWASRVTSAGSVFLGPWSPESAGDYASGANHVLPTHGFARSMSGLSVESFQKKITFQELTAEGLADIGPTVQTLAELEGLAGHARAVRVRLERMAGKSS